MLQMCFEMLRSINSLPKYMQDLRNRRSMTQVDAAKLAGITSTAVAYVERGERLPRIDTLCVLLDIYGSSLKELAADLGL